MSLNKLLCKYLDRDDKGYVTMGNLITAAGVVASLLIVVIGYVRGAITIMEHWDGKLHTSIISALNEPGWIGCIDAICIPVTIGGTGLVLTIILSGALALSWIIFCDVWTAKIAKCERKDGD